MTFIFSHETISRLMKSPELHKATSIFQS